MRDRDAKLAYAKAYYRANPEPTKRAARLRYERLKAAGGEEFKAGWNAASAANRRKLRQEAIAAFGGECACCHETELEFLVLDHVNGGGRKHVARISPGGSAGFYWALKKAGWKSDVSLRVLCQNCNMATRYGKTCPHQTVEYVIGDRSLKNA